MNQEILAADTAGDIMLNQIEDFLFSYSPFESFLRDYYQLHQRPADPREYPEEFLMPYEISPTDLHSLTIPSDQEPAARFYYSLSRTFLEYQYFAPDFDIYIQKQLRYSKPVLQNHHFYEICYQYTGSSQCILSVGDHNETLTLKSGDFLFIPEGRMHASAVNSDSILIDIGIRTSTFKQTFAGNIPENSIFNTFFSSLIDQKTDSIYYILFHSEESQRIRRLVQQLMLTYCSGELYAPKILNLQLSILFLELLQYNNRVNSVSIGGNNIATRITAIIHYMELNYCSASSTEIARHFGYSQNHLNHIFKSLTSHTIGETLLHLKMQKADTLLTGTSLSINAIAEYLGYKNPTNLIRSFKKYYGMTPAQYRKTKTLQL